MVYDHATQGERRILDAVAQTGSPEAAAVELGIKTDSVTRQMRSAHAKAAQRMSVDDERAGVELPAGFISKGPSVFRNAQGEVVSYWDKRKAEGLPESERVRIEGQSRITKVSTNYVGGQVASQWVAEVPEKMAVDEDRIVGILNQRVEVRSTVPVPTDLADDLMTIYPVGDHHFGMLAWADEVLEDYDIKIGQKLLTDAMRYLVDNSPPAGTALIALMGDFMHWSGEIPVTPRSGHSLDADSRLGRIVEVAIEATIGLIDMALEKHQDVRVIVELGNHDGAGMIWLSRAMQHIFKANDRVTIDTAPGHFHGFAFGDNFIGTHHGHGRAAKFKDLPLIFLNDFDEFATCKKRLILTGHVHHDHVVDVHGVQVESLGILPPGDAHAFNEGYRSMRRMHSMWMHKTFGEINRQTVTPEMLAALGSGYDCNLGL